MYIQSEKKNISSTPLTKKIVNINTISNSVYLEILETIYTFLTFTTKVLSYSSAERSVKFSEYSMSLSQSRQSFSQDNIYLKVVVVIYVFMYFFFPQTVYI